MKVLERVLLVQCLFEEVLLELALLLLLVLTGLLQLPPLVLELLQLLLQLLDRLLTRLQGLVSRTQIRLLLRDLSLQVCGLLPEIVDRRV